MPWSLRYAIKSYLVSAIWTAPVGAVVLEQLTFRIAYISRLDFGFIPGFALDKDGTLALCDYVIASCIAFIVFTFSSLIVAIQVASGQLTPRIIATALLRDKAIRRSVGLFVYTLLLAIGIKARVDTIPHSLESVLGILGLTNVLVFMFLIDYAARLLRPISIVWRIANQGFTVIDDVYPQSLSGVSVPAQAPENLGPAVRTVLHRGDSSVVIAINVNALVKEAKKANAFIEFMPRVGDFVASGDPLFQLRGAGVAQIDDRFLRSQVAFGRERTIEQDSTFAFRVIVDIALKALSPAINDPTTAVIAIDQLQRLLRTVGNRKLHDERIFDDEQQLRLILRTPNWKDFLELTFSEIRQCGAGNFQVARRLRAMMEVVMQTLPESRMPLMREQLALLDRAIEKLYSFPEDRTLARVGDSQGLGGASVP
jgi:uncharacterized membrane protein